MSNIKLGFNISGKYILCVVMCFFVTFSFIALFSMLTLEMIGYEAVVYVADESQEVIDTYNHYYSDGEDTKKAEYEAKGYKVSTREFTGEFEGTPYVACHIISQTVCLIIFVMTVPNSLYKQGKTDANTVSCGRMEEDKLRGLKAGVVTAVFNLASWVALVLGKLGLLAGGLQVYAFSNYYLYGYQQLIFGSQPSVSDIGWNSIVLALLPAVLVLVLCWLTYLLGYKDINLYEETVYKKN